MSHSRGEPRFYGHYSGEQACNALGAGAFFLQFGGPPVAHRTSKSQYAGGTAGSPAHLSGRFHLSAHLPHFAGAPLLERRLLQRLRALAVFTLQPSAIPRPVTVTHLA